MTEAETAQLIAYIIGAFGVGYGLGILITTIRKLGDKI